MGSLDSQAHTKLVERAIEGDLSAFDSLVACQRETVINIVRSILSDRDSVNDVVQEVFLKAFKSLQALHSPESFDPWLHAIARNSAKRWAIAESRTRAYEPSELDRLLIRKSTQLASLAQSELEAARVAQDVLDEIESLPETIAAAARMHYKQGRSVAEIASELSISASAVKWRLGEARQRVRRKLTTSETE